MVILDFCLSWNVLFIMNSQQLNQIALFHFIFMGF
uniref:Uncharacterized protein n=1 Tax=Anguilla anguilla TaxID=7936 RepID=A0A0E9SXM7_ANGAN